MMAAPFAALTAVTSRDSANFVTFAFKRICHCAAQAARPYKCARSQAQHVFHIIKAFGLSVCPESGGQRAPRKDGAVIGAVGTGLRFPFQRLWRCDVRR